MTDFPQYMVVILSMSKPCIVYQVHYLTAQGYLIQYQCVCFMLIGNHYFFQIFPNWLNQL